MKKKIEITPNIETLFGTRDENLHVLEDGLNIGIDLRSDSIELEGAARDVARAEQVFTDYDHLQRSGFTFNNGDLNSMLRVLMADPKTTLRGLAEAGRQRSLGRRTVQPKSVNQRRYLEAIENHDMVFGIGPAGTGKTYLAVAMAISALLSKRVIERRNVSRTSPVGPLRCLAINKFTGVASGAIPVPSSSTSSLRLLGSFGSAL